MRRCSGLRRRRQTLNERFFAACKIAPLSLKLDTLIAATCQVLLKTYQALLKLLRVGTTVLVVVLHRRMQEDLDERFTVAGFAAFGVDGSRLQLPGRSPTRAALRPRPSDGRSPGGVRPSPKPFAGKRRRPTIVTDLDAARRHRAAPGLAVRTLRPR